MVGQQPTGETAGFPDEILVIKTEVVQRLAGAADFDPSQLEMVQGLTDECWRELVDTIDDPDSMDNITGDNWATSHAEPGTEPALRRLASIKAMPPEEDIKHYKHGVSVENHMKLALEAAGDMDSLRVFGEILRAKLMSGGDKVLAQQALLVWAPVAEVAGWHELRTELEEAGFESLYPDEKKAIEDTYAHLGGDEALEKLVEEYQDGMGIILEDELDPDVKFKISGRKKAYYSVWRKVTRDGRPSYALPDFLGMRIIVTVDSDDNEARAVENCYAVADIVGQCFTPEPDRHKDYIANPKSNGYQSLHMTLTDVNDARVEFQIRTSDMHEKAETDPNASHMIYNASGKITPGRHFSAKMPRPARIYGWREEAATEIRRRREAGDNSLESLEPGTLLVFSKDGHLHQFQEGDTALDFSFAIHNRHALSTQAIYRKEGRPARLDGELRYGDVMTIQYHPVKTELTWEDSWLEKVHSGGAKKTLRKAQRERDAPEHIAKGLRIVVKELGARGLKAGMLAALEDEHRAAIAEKLGIKSFDTVLRNIGASALKPGKVVSYMERLAGVTHERKKPRRKTGGSAEQVYEDADGGKWEIAALETLKIHHHFAGCCAEKIKVGKPIVAVPSRLRGDLSIHTPGCVNLPDDGRVLESTWHAV